MERSTYCFHPHHMAPKLGLLYQTLCKFFEEMAYIDINYYGRCSLAVARALVGSSFFTLVFLIKVGGRKAQVFEIKPYNLVHIQVQS